MESTEITINEAGEVEDNNNNNAEEMMMDTTDDLNQQKQTIVRSKDDEENDDDNDDDDIVDDIPDFINADDVVEVQVDDDDIPMDDDEIEEEDDALEDNEEMPEVTDMSKIQIKTHTGPVYTIASYWDSVKHQLIVTSGGGDDKAYLHRTTSELNVSRPPVLESTMLQHMHSDSVSSVAINLEYIPPNELLIPNNPKFPKLIAVGGYDGVIVLYDADTGMKVTQLEGPTDVEWISFHPKGGTVLLVGSAAEGTVWMYHMLASQQYKCLQVFVGHEQSVNAGTFSNDGKWAITASADGTVRIWAPRTGLCKHVFRFDQTNNSTANGSSTNQSSSGLTTMSINGGTDGQLLLVGSEDGYGHVCHIGTKRVLTSLRHYEPPVAAGIVPQGNDDESTVQELPMSVEAVGFAPALVNPNWCATGGVDGLVKIWDLSIGTGQCRQICQPPTTIDSTNLTDGQVQQQKQQQSTTKSKYGGITRLQWHPTLPIVIVSHTGGAIHFWDARNGQLVHAITGSNDVVNDMSIHFIPSTDINQQHAMKGIIITASDDNIIRLFDMDLTTIIH